MDKPLVPNNKHCISSKHASPLIHLCPLNRSTFFRRHKGNSHLLQIHWPHCEFPKPSHSVSTICLHNLLLPSLIGCPCCSQFLYLSQDNDKAFGVPELLDKGSVFCSCQRWPGPSLVGQNQELFKRLTFMEYPSNAVWRKREKT